MVVSDPSQSAPRWRTELSRWGLAPGSATLIALRCVALLILTGPFMLLVRRGLSDDVARVGELTQPSPPSLTVFAAVLGDISPMAWAAALGGCVLWWLVEPWLSATLLAVTVAKGRPRVWRHLWDEAWPRLPVLLRVSAVGITVSGLGAAGISWLFSQWHDHAQVEGANASTTLVWLPVAQAALTLSWWVAVGLFALWCRVLVMADGRARLRRVIALVPRVWVRAPIRSFLLLWALTLAVQVCGAVLIPLAAPGSPLGRSVILWIGYVLLQMLLWHGALRSSRLLYAEPSFEAVRSRPDAPWGWLAKLWGWMGRR